MKEPFKVGQLVVERNYPNIYLVIDTRINSDIKGTPGLNKHQLNVLSQRTGHSFWWCASYFKPVEESR